LITGSVIMVNLLGISAFLLQGSEFLHVVFGQLQLLLIQFDDPAV
jgi:hypothetical protein